jgi:hypothetical protein
VSTSIRAGELLTLDPSDKRVVTFDWDLEALPAGVTIASYVHTISVVKQNGLTALTKDNESNDSRTTELRLLATTATNGDRYRVACKITTSENPAQEIERQISVLVQNR